MKTLRAWLLVPDAQLRSRDRFILATLRVVIAASVLTSLVLVVLPFLMDNGARDGLAGDLGMGGLVVLCCVLPLCVLPYALWQSGTLRFDDDVLVAYTLWDRRDVDLGKVQAVRVWSLDARGIFAKLSGEGIPAVWLNWSGFGFDTSERLQELTHEVASREGVWSSSRAREVLEFPDAPRGLRSLLIWLRDLGGAAAYGLGMAVVLVAYVNLLFGLPVWSV